MIPQLGAPTLAGGAAQPAPEASATRGASPDAPPRAQAAARPETARAVDPPQPAGRGAEVTAFARRDLNPPDPKAPAGPPPAFEASILDRAREEAMRPPDLREAKVVAADAFLPPDVARREAGPPAPGAEGEPAPRAEAVEGPRIARPAGEEVAPEDDTVPEVAPVAPTAREAGAGDRPGGDPVAGTDAEGERGTEERRRPYDVPPSAEERAERQVATIRRIETPYDTATVDVSR